MNDPRLQAFATLKRERDKGRWTDDEYRRLMTAIREGVEPYERLRAQMTGKPAPTPKPAKPSALTDCPDCGHTVSRNAAACPQCGAPLGVRRTERGAIGEAVVTTQGTSKRLKAYFVLFWAMTIIGFTWMLTLQGAGEPVGTIPAFMAVIGMIGLVVTRVRRWWHHA